jgi:hypothetical protein
MRSSRIDDRLIAAHAERDADDVTRPFRDRGDYAFLSFHRGHHAVTSAANDQSAKIIWSLAGRPCF